MFSLDGAAPSTILPADSQPTVVVFSEILVHEPIPVGEVQTPFISSRPSNAA